MSLLKSTSVLFLSTILIIAISSVEVKTVNANLALGVRAGLGMEPDQFVIGGQAELRPFLGPATFVPSVDLGLSDGLTVTAINLDLRWYLLPLPETGIYFYGAVGPTLAMTSPDRGASENEIGLSLTGGIKIPMRGKNRYNLEARFGLGNIPDLKVMFGVLFGL